MVDQSGSRASGQPSHVETVLALHGVGAAAPTGRWLAVGVLLLGVGILAGGFFFRRDVTVEVDGRQLAASSIQRTTPNTLRDLGIMLEPGDRASGQNTVRVQRALPVVVHGDSQVVSVRAAVNSPREAAEAAGFTLGPHDQVMEVARPAQLQFVSANPVAADDERLLASIIDQEQPARFRVLRAVQMTVHERGMAVPIWTTGATVGEALVSNGFEIYDSDEVQPAASSPAQEGLHVYIQRAKPVSIEVDGLTIPARTRETTVQALLKQEGLALDDGDRLENAQGGKIPDSGPIKIIRVRDQLLTNEEPIDFDVQYRDLSDLEAGQTQVLQEGVPGLRKWTTRIVYENGKESGRQVVRSWVERPPQPKIVGRGAKAVYREIPPSVVATANVTTNDITTSDAGQLEYWGTSRVYVTAYNAESAGKPKGSPGYGITSTGARAGRGIIAVDPNYIPYGTRMYVPGYGVGIAADTGGGIRGAHIDICFDDDEPINWESRTVQIYFLSPAPPVDKIRHLLNP